MKPFLKKQQSSGFFSETNIKNNSLTIFMFKKILIGGAIISTMMLGDYINILDRTIYPLKYNQKIDNNSYQRPFKLRKKYVINNNDCLEIHIGHNNKWAKVKKDLITKDRDLDEILAEKGRKIKEEFLEWYNNHF